MHIFNSVPKNAPNIAQVCGQMKNVLNLSVAIQIVFAMMVTSKTTKLVHVSLKKNAVSNTFIFVKLHMTDIIC